MNYNSSSRNGLINFEQEILSLYDNGILVKDICLKLNIARGTVHNYLKKNNRRRYINHTFNDFCFSIFTPESCYWAGFIAADGNIDKRLTNVRLDLNIKDKSHIEKFLKFTKDENIFIVEGKREVYFKSGKSFDIEHCRADINSTKIVKDLVDNFNIIPAKSFILLPPDKIPNNLVSHYIRGYFDGDGSIFWNKFGNCAMFNIVSGSKNLLDWTREKILKNVNFDFSGKYSIISRKPIFKIEFAYSTAIAIFDWLYSESTQEIRLDRKYERYLDYTNH